MKMKDEYVKTELGEDALLVPIGEEGNQFHGVILLNETAAFIVDRLRQDVTEEDLVQALLNTYDVKHNVAEKHVRSVLEKLRKVNALTD